MAHAVTEWLLAPPHDRRKRAYQLWNSHVCWRCDTATMILAEQIIVFEILNVVHVSEVS